MDAEFNKDQIEADSRKDKQNQSTKALNGHRVQYRSTDRGKDIDRDRSRQTDSRKDRHKQTVIVLNGRRVQSRISIRDIGHLTGSILADQHPKEIAPESMVQQTNTTPTESTVTQSAMPFIEILTQVSTFNHAEPPAAAIVTNRKPVQFLHCPSSIGGPEKPVDARMAVVQMTRVVDSANSHDKMAAVYIRDL